MKKLYLICFLLFFKLFFSQEKNSKFYDDAILLIKNSKEFNLYSAENKALNNNFKIDNRVFSICEWYTLFQEETNNELTEHCIDENWIDDEVKKNCYLRKKSDNGKKSFNVIFTNIIENYFITEVKFKNDTNRFLVFLFKIKEDNVFLLKEKIVQIN